MPDHEYPSNVELILTVTDPMGGTTVENTVAEYRTYTYAVRAEDAAGNLSWRSNLVSRTANGGGGPGPDTERPSPPRGLRANAQPWGIELTWTASTDNVGVTNYVIYRSTDGSLGEPWRTIDGNRTSFGNGMVTPGVTYTYALRARDAAGNLSWRSNLSSEQAGG